MGDWCGTADTNTLEITGVEWKENDSDFEP